MFKYILVLYVVTYALQIIVLTNGGLKSSLFDAITPIVMYMPAALTIGYVLITKKGLKSINWKLGKPIYLLYGALLPALLSLFLMVLIGSLGYGESAHLVLEEGQVNILKGRFVMGNGLQSYGLFAVNMISTVMVFSLLSGFFAFGEELGWRGFLQEKLIDKWGLFKGVTILGFTWGFWHFPYTISGYNYPETPILGAFVMFPLLAVFASFFLAWLTIKAKSFWPAVLAHGSVNAFMGSIVQGMDFGTTRLEADIVVLAVWFIVGTLSYLGLKQSNNG
ncbi:MAG: CPBP family intramembrane metalloprotease [Flavobacteriaceae bacterium]|nr:CPBP family intramembrane metalloprotease [Flavobacteriaceae bacterium]